MESGGALSKLGAGEDPALSELREAYSRGNLVVFAGAALSTAAGLPSWATIVRTFATLPGMSQAPARREEMLALLQGGKLVDALTVASQVLLKLHGTLLDRSSWVFTRSQYDRVIWADPLFRTTFSALFLACPILFVGFGMVDDNFESLFSQVRALSGDQPPRHFALMPKGALQGIRRDRVSQAGVRVIEYPNLDGKHSDVARILEWLAEGDPHRFPEAAPA